MHLWRTILTLAFTALWPLMASHCLLESLPSLSFLECVSDSPSEAGCDDDACSTVESGYYKTEDNQTFLATMFVWINFCPVELLLPPLLPTAEVSSLETAAPPEFSASRQFVFRTASPPRAPSFAS